MLKNGDQSSLVVDMNEIAAASDRHRHHLILSIADKQDLTQVIDIKLVSTYYARFVFLFYIITY